MKKGFTLIELMIVVAIISILATIAVPSYQSYITRAHNASAQSLLKHLALSEEAYNIDHFSYALSADISSLAAYGFRPDPNVAFEIGAPVAAGSGAGYIAYAAFNRMRSTLYIYNTSSGSGMNPYSGDTENAGFKPTTLLVYRIEFIDGNRHPTFIASPTGIGINTNVAPMLVNAIAETPPSS